MVGGGFPEPLVDGRELLDQVRRPGREELVHLRLVGGEDRLVDRGVGELPFPGDQRGESPVPGQFQDLSHPEAGQHVLLIEPLEPGMVTAGPELQLGHGVDQDSIVSRIIGPCPVREVLLQGLLRRALAVPQVDGSVISGFTSAAFALRSPPPDGRSS